MKEMGSEVGELVFFSFYFGGAPGSHNKIVMYRAVRSVGINQIYCTCNNHSVPPHLSQTFLGKKRENLVKLRTNSHNTIIHYML